MISQTNAAQERASGLTTGTLAAAVVYLGDDAPTVARLLLAFTGGYIVGSRRLTVQSIDPAPLDPTPQ